MGELLKNKPPPSSQQRAYFYCLWQRTNWWGRKEEPPPPHIRAAACMSGGLCCDRERERDLFIFPALMSVALYKNRAGREPHRPVKQSIRIWIFYDTVAQSDQLRHRSGRLLTMRQITIRIKSRMDGQLMEYGEDFESKSFKIYTMTWSQNFWVRCSYSIYF